MKSGAMNPFAPPPLVAWHSVRKPTAAHVAQWGQGATVLTHVLNFCSRVFIYQAQDRKGGMDDCSGPFPAPCIQNESDTESTEQTLGTKWTSVMTEWSVCHGIGT